MDANSNSDLAQDSEVVDDEPTVPVSFPDDTHDVSRKASVLDPEKRRRLEEEDEEDDKNSDRHRRKKKKVRSKYLKMKFVVNSFLKSPRNNQNVSFFLEQGQGSGA